MYNTKIEDTYTLKKCFELREEVFVDEQGYDKKKELDVFDSIKHKKSVFYATIEARQVIATLRLINNVDYVKISRVCVKKEYRNKGIMKNLINEVIDEAIKENLFNIQNKYFYVEAQKETVEFYAKLGFVKVGEELTIEGQLHQKMKLMSY